MTLLSSLDTGTSAPRAPGTVPPETMAAPPGSVGAAQSFARLMAELPQPPDATGAAAQTPAAGAPDMPADAAPDGLPDMIARLLQPMAETGAPNADVARDVAQTLLPEGEPTAEPPVDATAAVPRLPDPQALAETPVLPDAHLPSLEDPIPEPVEATEDTAAADAAEPPVATDPTLSPPATMIAPPAPPRTAEASGADDTPPEPMADAARIAPAAKPEGKADRAPTGPAAPAVDTAPPDPTEIAPAQPAETALPLTEPGATATETPRAVAVSVTQAPATPNAQSPATALPVLQTLRPDWPLDLAERLVESASLRGLATGGLMEIRLDPDTLGPVTLRLEVADGTANVAIVTQTPEAARLFTDNQQRLADALARAGLDLGQHSAGTDARGGQQGRDRPGSDSTPDTQRPEAPPRRVPQDRRVDLIA